SGTYLNGFLNGKELTVLGEEGWYYHVRILIGGEVKTGYMHKLLVYITSPTPDPTTTTTKPSTTEPTTQPTVPARTFSDDTYVIKNMFSKKFLSDNPSKDKAVQYSLGSYNHWTLVYKPSSGYYEIILGGSPTNRFALWVENAGTTNGTDVQTLPRDSSTAQRFRFISSGSGTYRIVPQNAQDKVLDVRGPLPYDDVQIQLWDWMDVSQQKWKLALANAFLDEKSGNVCGLASQAVTIRLIGLTTKNSIWSPIIETSRNVWNNSEASVNITTTETASSNHTLEVAIFEGDQDGKCIQYCDSNGVTVFSRIEINLWGESNLDTTTNNNLRQAAVSHEMGHLFWLSDNPISRSNATVRSLMEYDDVYKRGIYTPQSFDVNNVKFIYE
ncbi:MAG: RICIN domain-containing protein, partial [Oscillospiraceae bacterium]|nr:RICIN domain-containing protein [Oscillospiraceae bacterium]